MENLTKQQGEKQRKIEVKGDSKAHAAPEVKKTEHEHKNEEHAHTHTEHSHEGHDHSHEGHTHEHENKASTEVKTEEKKKVEQKPRVKKELAFIRMNGLSISTKHSIAICDFIKGKTIEQAISDLERVVMMKMAVPMKGEIPHRKGPIMAGRYPKNAAEVFINILMSLAGNSNVNGIDNPVITIASASWAARPMRKGGRRFKRTYLYIEAREAKEKKQKSDKKNKEKKE